jgi:protein-S-isoprenylcysteine O-methyltransferase Ste14
MSDRPFALRSTLYTIGFLLFILGLVPSAFYIAGERLFAEYFAGFWATARAFWASFRVLVGAAIFAIGLAGYTLCSAWLIYFGKGPHVEFDPPKVFVATGPYRWVRNPVVLTLLVTVLGEALFTGSVGILILLALGIPLAHYQVTRIEEPRLRARFGQSYVDYCANVPRWTPRYPSTLQSNAERQHPA